MCLLYDDGHLVEQGQELPQAVGRVVRQGRGPGGGEANLSTQMPDYRRNQTSWRGKGLARLDSCYLWLEEPESQEDGSGCQEGGGAVGQVVLLQAHLAIGRRGRER